MDTEETRVLFVDHFATMRRIIRSALHKVGFVKIEEARDGEEAVELLKTKGADPVAGYHVILLDWNMPVMSGIEFLEKLRSMDGGDKPKVVFCTTENDIDHIQRAISAGANEYIMKPFDSEIIESKFAQIGLIERS